MINKRVLAAVMCMFFILVNVLLPATSVRAASDTTPPVLNSISVDKHSGTNGENITVSVDASDDISGVKSIEVFYEAPQGNSFKFAELSKGTNGKYTGTVPVGINDAIGTWKVSFIALIDNSYNSINVYNSEVFPSNGNVKTQNLSGGDFQVFGTNPDVTPPVVSKISVDRKTGTNNENITVTLDASDDISGIQSIYVYYDAPAGNAVKRAELEKGLDGKYRGSVDINKNDAVGIWKVSFISLEDNTWNSTDIFNSEVYESPGTDGILQDLSAGDFEVVGTASDITPPVLNNISVDKKAGVSGEKIIITADASDDISGIQSIELNYEAPKGNSIKHVELKRDNDGKYRGQIPINSDDAEGIWKVNFISLVDNILNSIDLFNSEVYSAPGDDGKLQDLSAGDFEVKRIIAVTGITVDKTNINLNVGGKSTITSAVSPQDATNKSVTWTTSDAKVATVDNGGNVTATGAGVATITATTVDGAKTASSKVTVANPVNEVNGLPSVAYQGHVQNIGWQDYVRDGALSGTEGRSLRVEGFKIKLENAPAGLKIKYKTHVQNIGWQDWVYDGAMAGTQGRSLRVEALQIALEGTDADKYSVVYQAHVENEGWQNWVQDGQVSGSFGKSQRIEALRIKIVEKSSVSPSVLYQGHVQNIGWQDYVKNGDLSGTQGKSLRIEGFKIKLENAPAGLRVKYKAHVQNIGWQDWVYDGALAGTQGKSLRVEALQIALEGADADKYTIKYQAHVQNVGWQNWVQDGQITGTFGKSQRIEALRIIITKK
ncbi:Ig-like domain-containing protein [Clostridium yunnanense]|uniref:DUF7743 domain-containing protein n=1 Tax=Clostridium yunnanense TaxID=2800325 RepID=UPI001A9C454B|nr:Ig-like domain-containing protein [Clostridium yunnanense]